MDKRHRLKNIYFAIAVATPHSCSSLPSPNLTSSSRCSAKVQHDTSKCSGSTHLCAAVRFHSNVWLNLPEWLLRSCTPTDQERASRPSRLCEPDPHVLLRHTSARSAADLGEHHVCQRHRWLIPSALFVRCQLCGPIPWGPYSYYTRGPEKLQSSEHISIVSTSLGHIYCVCINFLFTSASFWGCLMQATGYGFAMPLYSILFLLRPAVLEFRGPDLVDRIRPRNLAELEVLPIALGLGYVLLAIAMSQPSVPNYLHQWLGALWQASPFWIMVWQKLLAAILARWRNTIQKGGDNIQIRQGLRPGSPMNSNTRHVERMLLGRAYELAFFSCLASHIAPLVFITIASSDIPVFSSLASEALTFSNVFIPPSPIWVEKMASMASGIHSFFQYDQYLGSAAAIIWSWTLWYNYSGNESNTTTATTETLRFGFVFLVASPAGTVVWFIWDRDHRLLIRHESTKKH